jgi:hypothetical protein
MHEVIDDEEPDMDFGDDVAMEVDADEEDDDDE